MHHISVKTFRCEILMRKSQRRIIEPPCCWAISLCRKKVYVCFASTNNNNWSRKYCVMFIYLLYTSFQFIDRTTSSDDYSDWRQDRDKSPATSFRAVAVIVGRYLLPLNTIFFLLHSDASSKPHSLTSTTFITSTHQRWTSMSTLQVWFCDAH